MLPETEVAYGAEADVEKGYDAHAHVKDHAEVLRLLHLILQGQYLRGKEENVSQTENRFISVVSLRARDGHKLNMFMTQWCNIM